VRGIIDFTTTLQQGKQRRNGDSERIAEHMQEFGDKA
jgi:hypothetical protein